jgi:hypothetical protein
MPRHSASPISRRLGQLLVEALAGQQAVDIHEHIGVP